MKNLLKYIMLIFVYSKGVVSDADSVRFEIDKLKKMCVPKSIFYFADAANTTKHPLLGKGSYGSVHALGPKKVIKLMESNFGEFVKKQEQEDGWLTKAMKGVKNYLTEISYMELAGKKKSSMKKLGAKNVEEKSLFVLAIDKCYMYMEAANDIPRAIMLGLELERLNRELSKFFKMNPKLTFLHLTELFKKILVGLYQMHQLGYAHLDLKPDNIMMRSPFDPVLIDFGLSEALMDPPTSDLSKLAKFEKKLTTIRGTPIFIDTVIFSQQNYSFKADLYSVGIMLFSYFVPSFDWNAVFKNSRPTKTMANVIKEKASDNDKIDLLVKNSDMRARLLMPLMKKLITDDLGSRFYLKESLQGLEDAEDKYLAECKKKPPTKELECMDRNGYKKYREKELKDYEKAQDRAIGLSKII